MSIRTYGVSGLICLGLLLLDQWTKHLILQKVPLHHSVVVIPGFFNLTHVRNTGGAFGILAGQGRGGFAFFLILSVVAIGAIVYFYVKEEGRNRRFTLPLPFVLSGAIGNLIDRLRHGEVVDFLDFYVSSFHWPAFNIADSAICVGIGLLAWELLIWDRQKKGG
jgi:signal peptidase II